MTYPRAIAAIGGVLVLNQIAVIFDLYYHYKWFDIPMHFLGGFVIGLFAIAILNRTIESIQFKNKSRFGKFISPLFILGFVALIGIVWEWHEFLLDQINSVAVVHQPSVGDTMADFVLDLFGGLIAMAFFWRGL